MFSLRGYSWVFLFFFLGTLPTRRFSSLVLNVLFCVYFSEALMASLFTGLFSRLTELGGGIHFSSLHIDDLDPDLEFTAACAPQVQCRVGGNMGEMPFLGNLQSVLAV